MKTKAQSAVGFESGIFHCELDMLTVRFFSFTVSIKSTVFVFTNSSSNKIL